MTATPGWAVPATPDPAPSEITMRNCQLCGRRGPDPVYTSELRQAVMSGRAAAWPNAVTAGMVRWHEPQPVPHARAHTDGCGCGRETVPLLQTMEYRCEDHEACYQTVVDFGEEWPVNDGRPRRRSRPVDPGMTLVEAIAEREASTAHGDSPPSELDAEPASADADLDWGFGA